MFRDSDVISITTTSSPPGLYEVCEPPWWRLDRWLVVLVRRACGRPLVTITTIEGAVRCQQVGR